MFEFKKPQTSPKASFGLMSSLKALGKSHKKSMKVVAKTNTNRDSSDTDNKSSVLSLSEYESMVK